MEEALLEILNQYGYKGRDAKIFIQCFEVEPLKKLRFKLGTDLPLVLLTWEKNWNYGGDVKPFSAKLTEDILDEIAIYADGIGPNKDRIEVNPAIVQWAHERGLWFIPGQCVLMHCQFSIRLLMKNSYSFISFTRQMVFLLTSLTGLHNSSTHGHLPRSSKPCGDSNLF